MRLRHQTQGRKDVWPAGTVLGALSPDTGSPMLSSAGLTVITSTYNQEQYVADAIESVLAQRTQFPVHLIISDDASTDSSLEIVDRYRARHPDVITVLRSKENTWYFAAVLRALEWTRTEYFCLLDADDYWIDPLFLQRGFDFLEDHPEFAIYGANCVHEFPDGTRSPFISEEVPSGEFCFDDFLQGQAVISQTAGTIYRNVLFRSGVPKVFADMLGTRAQYSFACDYQRYPIYLEHGKARFDNRPVGVYRITGEGIYSGLSAFQKALWEAETRLDQWRYFGHRYPEYFLAQARQWAKECLKLMNEMAEGGAGDSSITPERVAALWRVVEECASHSQLLHDKQAA
jgi:glycosyltransferase involved in cell wall biosynthesis